MRRARLHLILATVAAISGCGDTPVEPDDESDPISEVRILGGRPTLLGIGASLDLDAQVLRGGREDRDEPVEWATSDPSVAVVENGAVQSVGYGTSTISATAGDVASSFAIEVVGSGDFTYASGSITLSARLTLPAGNGPFPAVVTVHGSEQARKENYQPPALISGGFAVLSYDKRGVGGSTGTYPSIGPGNSNEQFGLLADDALAGVAFLRRHADIDSTKIGLMGWSQAGWIIPLAAWRSDELSFMINVVGPTVTVGQEIYFSNLTGDSGTGPLPNGRTYEEIEALTDAFTGQDGFDPVPVLRLVDIPGLWVLGGQDRSIPTNLTIRNIEQLVADYGKPFEVHYYQNANHGVVDVTTGQRLPYISREGGVADWIFKTIND